MQSDAQIVRQVQSGNRQAYGLLVDRYERIVRAAALRLVGDRHTAEDVAQDAFLAGLEQLGSLRTPEKFGGWILTITRRTASRARARSDRVPAAVGDADALGDGADALSRSSRELMELVERLPHHEQTVVALRYLNGHSMAEIAEMTGRPLGTVTKQHSRACQRLRSWLAKEISR